MDVILALVKWKQAIVFTNDIIIISKTPEHHLQQIEDMLCMFRDAGMTIELKKCFSSRKIINCLDYVIATGKL